MPQPTVTCPDCGTVYYPFDDLPDECPTCHPSECRPDCRCGCGMRTCPCRMDDATVEATGEGSYYVSRTGFAMRGEG